MRRALLAAVAAALVAPGTAAAHLKTGRVAVDYRADVMALQPPLFGAVKARVYRSDLALGLRALDGHSVIVLGYFGEPFLRLGPAGVFVNDASLTAAGTGLAVARARSGKTPRWRLRSRKPSVIWHDARLRGLPQGERVGAWTVPLLVDGRPTRIGGEIHRVSAPSAWPWIAVGAMFAVVTGVVLARRSAGRLRGACVVLGWIAGLATILAAVGFATASTASEGMVVQSVSEIVLALVGIVFLIRGSRETRAVTGGLLGLLALAAGLTKLQALTHGIVLSALPGQLARLAVVVAISAGAAAAILVVLVVLDLLRSYEEPEALQRYL